MLHDILKVFIACQTGELDADDVLTLTGHHSCCLLGCDSVMGFIRLDEVRVVMLLRVGHVGW